jgi:hypothetical protein
MGFDRYKSALTLADNGLRGSAKGWYAGIIDGEVTTGRRSVYVLGA